MTIITPESSRERRAQERQYYFPYHYIPRREGARIVYAAALDWAGDYLESLDLIGAVVQETGARRICDVGCGDGRLINELAVRFPDKEFAGVDYSERAIALAELFRTAANARFVAGDLSSMGPASYDLVSLVEVLEHIPPDETADFLRRAFDLVAPGGTLAITVPHANKPLQAKHYRHFTGALLRRVLTESLGPVSMDVRFIDPVPRGIAWLVGKLARNRYFTIEPLFQRQLRRRAKGGFVEERRAGRLLARVRR